MPAPIPSIPRIRCFFAIILILICFMLLGLTRRAFSATCSGLADGPGYKSGSASCVYQMHVTYYDCDSLAAAACGGSGCSTFTSWFNSSTGAGLPSGTLGYWRRGSGVGCEGTSDDLYLYIACAAGICEPGGGGDGCSSERAVLEVECGASGYGYTIDERTCEGHCNTDGDQCSSERAALEQQCGGPDKYTIDEYTCEGECVCPDSDSDGKPDSCDACPDNPALFLSRLDYVVPDGSSCGSLSAGQSCGYLSYDCSKSAGEATASPAGGLSQSEMLTCCQSKPVLSCTMDSCSGGGGTDTDGGGTDTDGDGTSDDKDTDDDNDGKPDDEDPCRTNPDPNCKNPCEGLSDPNCRDTDGDGEPNSTDTDDDGDGEPDSTDTDDDGDGTPDDQETDTDGDGTSDEDDTDDDNDGYDDTEDNDDDGDGTPDEEETDPYQTKEAPYSFITEIGQQFGDRFKAFIEEMKDTSIFSIPGQIMGDIPSGGSPSIAYNGGEHFGGEQSIDLSSWSAGLAAIRAGLYAVFAAVAIRIGTLGR